MDPLPTWPVKLVGGPFDGKHMNLTGRAGCYYDRETGCDHYYEPVDEPPENGPWVWHHTHRYPAKKDH